MADHYHTVALTALAWNTAGVADHYHTVALTALA